MGKMRLSRKARRRATDVLLFYPDNVKEYNELMSDLLSKDPEHKGNSSKPLTPDPTAMAAIKLAENGKLQRLKTEVEAVEYAIKYLDRIELEVIRRRFFDVPRRPDGWRKPCAYERIDVPYSTRQMERIVYRVMIMVAIGLYEV